MKPVRVGSLFSGIGGLDLGLERAGMQIIYQVEKDPYCQKVLAKHWPEVPCYGDIKEIDFTTLPAVDLICGGFPCQPVSCAGKRQGDQDERWLWPEFYRAICEARPRWILVENVPGLLSASDGRLFGGILRDLAYIGFDAQWRMLPAHWFGAPHQRERFYMLSYPSSKWGKDRYLFSSIPKKAWRKARMGQFGGMDGPKAWIQAIPAICRNDDGIHHGISRRVDRDRLKCLGNAVVPQVAEWIGRRIMEAMTNETL
jgi:DNA (cytosine-5)-methyltransferase 1